MTRPNRPRDTNQLAKMIADLTTRQIAEPDAKGWTKQPQVRQSARSRGNRISVSCVLR